MKERLLVTTIDSLAALLAAYLQFPAPIRPLRFQINPANRLLGLEVEADTPIFDSPELVVTFRTNRVWSVGGGTDNAV
ncbi:MAG: hypothetical protein N2557_08520 [Hydrogenophilus sp.]|nr:hypothetical protein [Hydrogenophilus sp.]